MYFNTEYTFVCFPFHFSTSWFLKNKFCFQNYACNADGSFIEWIKVHKMDT